MLFFLCFFQVYSSNLAPLQRMVEDINDQASDFTSNNVTLSRQTLSRLEDINTRWVWPALASKISHRENAKMDVVIVEMFSTITFSYGAWNVLRCPQSVLHWWKFRSRLLYADIAWRWLHCSITLSATYALENFNTQRGKRGEKQGQITGKNVFEKDAMSRSPW